VISGSRQRTTGSRKISLPILLPAACCLLSLSLAAQEAPPEPPKDSALVAAARRAREGRVAIPRKVITNADVKKSKGKLIELPAKGAPLPPHVADARSTIEKHDEALKQAAAAERERAVAEKKITDLEAELAVIEQSYYDENDPSYRDDVIRKKFLEKKRELDAARAAIPK